MNTRYDIKVQLKGNKAVARDMLAILPLIEETFSEFEGQRAWLKSGARTAKLNKLWEEFQSRVDIGERTQLFIDVSRHSVRIEVKTMEQTDCGTWSYFYDSIYFGKLDGDSFIFDPQHIGQKYEYCNLILNSDQEALQAIADEYKALIKQADAIKDQIPYVFQEALLK